MEPIINRIQIALFPNNYIIKSPGATAANLLQANLISNENLIVNSFLTEKAPGEIARIEALWKENNNIRLNLAQSKISIYFDNSEDKSNFFISYDDIEDVIKRLLSALELDNITYNRIGYITNIYKIDNKPINLIRGKIAFKNNAKLRNANLVLTYDTSFQNKKIWKSILFNKHITLNDIMVSKKGGKPENAIGIQYDLNTRQGQKLEWKIREVLDFIKEAIQMSSSPSELYKEFFDK